MEISNKVFAIEKRGYSIKEVDNYLKIVTAEIEKHEKDMEDIIAKNDELTAKIEDYKSKEVAIKDILLTAHKTADSMIAEAKDQAALLENQAKLEYAKVYDEIKELRDGFAAYQNRLIEYVDKQKDWLLEFSDIAPDNTGHGHVADENIV